MTVKLKSLYYSEGHVGTVGSLKYRPGLTQRENILSMLQAQAVKAAVVLLWWRLQGYGNNLNAGINRVD